MEQLTLFGHSGEQLRDRGMKLSIESAGEGWAHRASMLFDQFLDGIPSNRRFMTEQVRQYAYDHRLPFPPSERAWGSLTRRKVLEGRIVACGTCQVSNPKAHRANATQWRKL